MRAPLPRRDWRKTVTASQGVALAIAAAGVVSTTVTRDPPGRRPRHARRVVRPRRLVAVAVPARRSGSSRRCSRPKPRPNQPCSHCLLWPSSGPRSSRRSTPWLLTPGSFVRLPLEGLVLVTLAVVLPDPRQARCAVGDRAAARPARAREALRPRLLHRLRPSVQPGRGLELPLHRCRDGARHVRQHGRRPGRRRCRLLLGLAALVIPTLAVGQLTRVAARHRRSLAPGTGRAHRRLGALLGVRRRRSPAPASPPRARRASSSTRCTPCESDLRDEARFMALIRRSDPYRKTPANRLLKGLRGKDVLLVFVESYGKIAVEGTSFSPRHRRRRQRRHAAARRPTASPPGAAGSPRRRSAEVAGSRTPRCSRAPGSTAQGRYSELIESKRLTLASRVRTRGMEDGRRRCPQPRRLAGGDAPSTTTSRSRTAGTSRIAARDTASPPCRTSTRCRPCRGSSSRGGTAVPSSPRSILVVEPRAVDAHSAADLLGAASATGRSSSGCPIRPDRPDRHPAGVRDSRSSTRCARCTRSSSTTATRTPCSSCWGTTSPRESSPTTRAPRRADHDHRPRPAVMKQARRLGLDERDAPSLDRAGLADERLPESLPQRV